MTREKWREEIRRRLLEKPRYEHFSPAKFQAVLDVTRALQKEADPEELMKTAALWPAYKTGKEYSAGDLVNVDGVLCRITQDIAVQDNFLPDQEKSLFSVVQRPGGEKSLTWMAGELVEVGDLRVHGDTTYRCLQAHTTLLGWEPTATPYLWEVAAANSKTVKL